MKNVLYVILLAMFAGAANCSEEYKPFALSPSLVDMCFKQREVMMCQQVEEFLARLSAEPRDDAWARAMELRLRRAFEVGGKGLAQVRAVECRSSRCAIEYAIDLQAAGPDFEMDPVFPDGLQPGTGALAYELNPRAVVTILCLTRKK